jgi:signal peptidase I
MGSSRSRRPLIIAGVAVLVLGALAAGGYLLVQPKASLPPLLQPLVGGRSVRNLGQSMAPALRDGQILTVDTRAYRDHPPQRGDIVLFTTPDDRSRLFIKRIIAIPGDRLLITNGTVSINGQVINESYLPERWVYNNSWPADGHAVVVPASQYFVMGDNRNHSSDSRAYGFVSLASIQGKLLL